MGWLSILMAFSSFRTLECDPHSHDLFQEMSIRRALTKSTIHCQDTPMECINTVGKEGPVISICLGFNLRHLLLHNPTKGRLQDSHTSNTETAPLRYTSKGRTSFRDFTTDLKVSVKLRPHAPQSKNLIHAARRGRLGIRL